MRYVLGEHLAGLQRPLHQSVHSSSADIHRDILQQRESLSITEEYHLLLTCMHACMHANSCGAAAQPRLIK